ncbi:hypothetical protein [Sphingomonas sp. NBWT7]|uniref:hypothetical protein n=1 Tax=Sphingomonas sp. NBWT7 TaxID=2596913 RepID=UPI001627C615|nr:hypothetical protein [Sphingomonas sp. NBWT7]
MRQAAPIALAGLGVVVAGVVAALPQPRIDLLVWRLWLPYVVPAAAPPVGVTGRVALAIAALLPFLGAALLVHLMAKGRLRLPARRVKAPATAASTVSVRRADAHPDAPPRRPIRASEDLGPPLPIAAPPPAKRVPQLEQPLPADLDQPLAAFDPIAVPDVPRLPIPAVPPLVVLPPAAVMVEPSPSEDAVWEEIDEASEDGDRWAVAQRVPAAAWEAVERAVGGDPAIDAPAIAMRTIEVGSPAADLGSSADAGDDEGVIPARMEIDRAMPAEPTTPIEPAREAGDTLSFLTAVPKPVGETSIATLLDRLERGARRRGTAAPTPAPAPVPAPVASLDDTLGMLRRLAAN